MNWEYYKGRDYNNRYWKVDADNSIVFNYYRGKWYPIKVRSMKNWLRAHSKLTSTEEEVFLDLI
jgi:hypothetical protein